MMIDWNEYHKQVLKGIVEIDRNSPEIIRGYRTIGDAAKRRVFWMPKHVN